MEGEGPLLNHLFARLNTRVKVMTKEGMFIEGVLRTIQRDNYWIEIDGGTKTFFVNMFKIVFIEAEPTDKIVADKEREKRLGK